MSDIIKVLTYNIRHGLGMDNKINLQRIAGIILASGADICALQEVDRCNPRSKMLHQAKKLAQLTNMYYVFKANMHFGLLQYGNAILSRLPLIAQCNYRLPGGREKRGLLKTVIALGGKKLNIFNTHLGLNQEERLEQVQTVKDVIAQTNGVVILTGDFNEESHQPAVKMLLADGRLADCLPMPNEPGLTYPADKPQKKIDYIIADKNCTVISAKAIPSLASDHLPYFCELKIP